MKLLSVTLSMLVLPALSAAQTPLSGGIWHGAIGALPISVCRNDAESPLLYYYHSQGKVLRLEADKEGFALAGGERWRKLRAQGDTISGEWHSGKGKQLALQLKAAAHGKHEADERNCAHPVFYQAMQKKVQYREEPPQQFGALAYRNYSLRLALEGFNAQLLDQRIELLAPGDGPKRINQALRKEFKLANGMPALLECHATALAAHGQDGDYTQEMKPVFARGPYLSIETSYSNFCGGAHPASGAMVDVWDLRSGQMLDVWRWFQGGKAERLPPKLERLLQEKLARAQKEHPDCAAEVAQNRSFRVWLSANGISFSTQLPYVSHACDDTAELSADSLRPFLNARGKQEMQALFGK
ncbi:hypothetical protein V8J88_18495 [Massilia sp. W12]|uniref:hypothetical protein n=1 Tax=Massilia sp. W12 TaxID=3126507 RepID=UPI0030D03C2D